MKCALLSLALLGGAPASGCSLRGSVDGRRTEEAETGGWRMASLAKTAQPGRVVIDRESLAADEAANNLANNARAKRIAGKKALTKACSEDVHFPECSQDKGSAHRLEACLKKRSNHTVSASCRRGLQSWKHLLAETAPDARNAMGHAPPGSKEAMKKALARSERVQEDKHLQQREEKLVGVLREPRPDVLDRIEEHFLYGAEPDHHPPHHLANPNHPHHPPHGHPAGHGAPGHFHHRASPDFLDGEEMSLPEERRPSMFSVLADWIFGDSWDSWGSSSSEDLVFSTTSAGGPASFVDAGFFPAGYGIPPGTNTFLDELQAADQQHPRMKQVFSGHPGKKPFRRGGSGNGDGNGSRNGPLHRSSPLMQPGRVPEPEPPLGEFEALFATVDLEEGVDWDALANPRMTKEGYGYRPQEVEEETDLVIILGGDEGVLESKWPRPNRLGGDELGELDLGIVTEQDLPMFAGGPRVHPKHHHRGDHIRFRNPLPEDFENQRAWLSDSFDVDGDGPDLVEAILAFFFFIGAMTLMLLPFFLLGRALKRMVRNGGGSAGGDDADAPDGYYALPEDAASATAAARTAAAEDDDSIVVTGTPVNPPPSVHL